MSDVHNHDDNCGCGHDHDHEHEEVVILTDEEGNEREFIIVDEMNVENNRYAILVPSNVDEEDGFIMRIEADENGEEYLIEIEDEGEWNKVVTAYDKLASEA